MLNVLGLSVSYGPIQALNNVDFTVQKGELVCLLGANGAGKTTTMRSITGLLKGLTGTVTFMGEDITRLRPDEIVRRGLVLVPEGRRVFPLMTVEENLQLGAFTRKAPPVMLRNMERCYGLFPRLSERKRQLAGSLSGGEQQMLAIARALMSEPKLLLLDEPSMGLAPIIVEEIIELLIQLNDEGTTILLVEQNARAALAVTDRAYVLEQGRVVLSGESDVLAESPQVQEAYLGGAH